MKRFPLRIGLTGGIGSGKSTVGKILVSCGAALIDADQIAREVTAPQGAAIPLIRTHFGDDYIDAHGAMDRERMRAAAFSDPGARARLEAIIHPLVTEHSERLTRRATESGHPALIFDIPLLVESGRWTRQLDAVIVVDCPPETQVERVMARNHLPREIIEQIMASQASRSVRRGAADMVIFNADCTLGELHTQVQQAAQRFGL
ncbi:MAG: dephospho-CoA kinase [Burkholderiaceae bacterium]|nr:dephospho-CoA kinase [Burkholderiaceae bacterium]